MNEDFVLFQEEFKKWQNLFGLIGYKIFFKYEDRDSDFATIHIDEPEMVAIVTLNSNVPDRQKAYRNIKRIAQHEAIHLLIGRLEYDSKYRHTTEDEINEAVEELVNRLEDLIP